MKIVKRALFYFILEISILLLQAYSVGITLSRAISDRIYYLLPVFVILIGLILGLFSYLFIQYSKRIKSFYLFGLNVSFILFALFLCFFRFQTWRENKRYGYNYESKSMLKTTDAEGSRYIATGFDLLQSNIASPRNLELKSYLTRSRDTLTENGRDTLHIIYFAYYFRGDKTKYFSKVSVLDNKPEISIFNGIADTIAEYDALSNQMNAKMKRTIDSLKPELDHGIIEFLENR